MIAAVLAAGAASLEAHGHGDPYETFPPAELWGRQVTLEVAAAEGSDDGQLVSVSFLDFDSKVTLRDVRFLVSAGHGDMFLFEREFDASHGFVVFEFVSNDGDVQIEEEAPGLFGSLLGLEGRKVRVLAPGAADGGLYKLGVTVLEAEGRGLPEPLYYDAGISVAQATSHEIDDPNFGPQVLEVITYYDEISDFGYDPGSRTITYSMPFEWTTHNINRTSVVHEEIAIPKTFGDLLVSEFVLGVNGVEQPGSVVNIDDFVSGDRVVHFIIPQARLLDILANGTDHDAMHFEVRPGDPGRMSAVTENGQYRIYASWEPRGLRSGGGAEVSFGITDVFLRDAPVIVPYEVAVYRGGGEIYRQSGVSSGMRGVDETVAFDIPGPPGGRIDISFENLDGNVYARAAIPAAVDRPAAGGGAAPIPDWVRDSAGWWAGGSIDDETFLQGMGYLIGEGIIPAPPAAPGGPGGAAVPAWVRDSAGWWAGGSIDDETFLRGIAYLVEGGLIRT